jgi:putative nucleotidyltransferase with HDIG domain
MSLQQSEITRLVEKMPAFPQSVTKVLELTAKAECSPKELVKVIEHDPIMTVKILKLVNSAFYGLPRPINSINHGVVYVGLNTVKNLSLSIAAIGMLPKKSEIDFDMDDFLLHSLGVAAVAKRLAGRVGVSDKEAADYFIAGLLHDFGKVVLAQFKPQEFKMALEIADMGMTSLHLAEKQIFDIDHAEIGGLLAETWKLPAELVESIRNHHHLGEEGVNNSKLLDCIFAANQIVNSLGIGFSGNRVVEPFPESVKARFGLDLEGLIAALGDLSNEIEQARAYIKQ